jgi:transposase
MAIDRKGARGRMAQRRVSVRKAKEILRLKFEAGLGNHRIARACGVSASTVWDTVTRFQMTGLDWPLSPQMSEGELERRLYRQRGSSEANPERVPNWARVQRELRRKHVTLRLLWEEYKLEFPDGFQYSWYCERYREWRKKIDLVMRQEHKLGEKLFLDWAGDTIPLTDPETGEIRDCYLFVGALGASNYTYAEPSLSQDLPAFLQAHVRMFEFFGGVPELLVPDNQKTGVTAASAYEPELNPAYTALAEHYGCAVLPARPHRPRDKAKVEAGVLLAERRILARLRKRTFFSLAEMKAAVAEQVRELNERPFQKLPGSRKSVFLEEEQPALRPLPARPYEHRERKNARVHIDYHVELHGHYYSVPYRLVREKVEIRYTQEVVEIFHEGLRVASHVRSDLKGRATTDLGHMPAKHRAYAEWSPERFENWARKVGPETERLILAVFERYPHPALAYRSCLGILRLEQRYGAARLEQAASRTLAFGGASYKSVSHVLKAGLDREAVQAARSRPEPLFHENLRGPDYFKS